MVLFASALLVGAPALAYESETLPIEVADAAVLFTTSTVDTGWLPADSPITVRFQIESLGGAAVDMAGVADLVWPDALTLGFTGEPGTGALTVDAALSAVSSVKFELFGYAWESEIDRRTVAVSGETLFDPFAMDGAAVDTVSVDTAGVATEVVSYSYEVFAGVSVDFVATLRPTGAVTYHGLAWRLDDGTEILTEGGTALVVPSGTPSEDMGAAMVGHWTASLDLTLTPTVSVCVPIFGCTDLASFEIPLPLTSDDFDQPSAEIPLSFPLPAMDTPALSYDLGEVEVGDLVNQPVAVANVGALDLEGEAGLTGSTYFTVFPGYFLAGSGSEDGVMVSFAPETEGEFAATLLLSSNDPNNPVLEVALTGTGVVLDDQGTDTATDGKVISSEVGGCGCAHGRGKLSAVLALLTASVALLRRRRT